MKDLFELCGECRHLSDSEVVYQLTNNRETSKRVNEMLLRGDNVSIEDVCQLLTPARRDMALAVIELYKRIIDRRSSRGIIRHSEDIYNLMKPYMEDLEVEECWAIYLNQSNRVVRKQRISIGGITSTQVDIRVILREALKCNATSMILCHNHPSGNSRPSNDDNRLTECLKNAGNTMNIKLLDHIVYGDKEYFSYEDEGRL